MSEEQTPEIPPLPGTQMPPLPGTQGSPGCEPPLREKLAQLRARYALAAQQQQGLTEQLRQVEAAMGPILGAIMALEELQGHSD